jgi:urease accessory protein
VAPYLKVAAAFAAPILVSPVVPPAIAHHVMGGELPSTAWHALLSGLGHPIIGIDHFAFVVGVGLMSQLAGRLVLLPFLFVAGTVLGCFVHVQGHGLPSPEPVIALTIAVAAAIVSLRARIPVGVLATLFLMAGAFHGYAYGESIVGAETTPLTAYTVGFAAIQYTLALGSGAVLRTIVRRDYLSETTAMRTAGAGIAVVAALAVVNLALLG